MLEVSFWNPDETGQIRRSSRVPNSKPGLSRFTECVLHQGRMEQFFLDAIRASHDPSSADPPLVVERMVMPTSMVLDENEGGNGNSDDDYDAHPVTVTLRHLTEAEATPTQMLSNMSDGLFRSNLTGDDSVEMLEKSRLREAREETVRAKYVVGCDGAHSWTRKMLGKEFEMVGEMTDFIWYGSLLLCTLRDRPSDAGTGALWTLFP